MSKIFEKLIPVNYLSSKFVLGLDVVLSTFASYVAAVSVRYFFKSPHITSQNMAVGLVASALLSFILFFIFKSYRSIIRHASLRSVARMSVAIFCKDICLLSLLCLLPMKVPVTSMLVGGLALDLLLTFSVLVMARVGMLVVYNIFLHKRSGRLNRKRIIIYGTGNKSVSILTRLKSSMSYSMVGFLEYGQIHHGLTIDDYHVYYFNCMEDVEKLKSRLSLDGVLFAIDVDARSEQDRLIEYCVKSGIQVLLAPSIDVLPDGSFPTQPIREVKIEDLLGRDEITIDLESVAASVRGKTVMVTGGAGSIGSELCRQLAQFGVKHLVIFDNAESPTHTLRLELEDNFKDLQFTPVIGDVRQLPRLDFVFSKFRPQVVFHAAAYKHVPLMEENPCEAVLVNVIGSRFVAEKCLEYGVEKMVMVSTDKAVNPTNIMGCAKRLAEIFVQSLGLAISSGKIKSQTKFVTTRFGNVLGSNGSVIPRFREQIAKGGPVTVTHPDITRFFMTIPEACRLVMKAATLNVENEIFVLDMGESIKIDHLARRMIELAGFTPDVDIRVEYSGLRPGEKLYEEVLASTEDTLPTSHEKIRIARVRTYDYEHACQTLDELKTLAVKVDIIPMVKLMKQTVPEYHSENSKFAELD